MSLGPLPGQTYQQLHDLTEAPASLRAVERASRDSLQALAYPIPPAIDRLEVLSPSEKCKPLRRRSTVNRLTSTGFRLSRFCLTLSRRQVSRRMDVPDRTKPCPDIPVPFASAVLLQPD